jgi:penicillin-binding protein 2
MIAAIAAILLRLFFIQVVDSSYKVTASNNVLHYVTQYPARGIIFDRKNEVLVSNQAAYDLMIIKNQVKAFDTLEFARLLSITKEQVQENFKSMMRSRYFSAYKQYPFIKQISAKDYARFQEKMFLFPGFFVQARTLRTYPFNIAGGLFGYVGEVDESVLERKPYYKRGDYIGINGLEKTYEEQLRGQKGVSIYMVDVHNQIKGSYADGKYDTIAVPGKNINLSIDAELQAYGEKLMVNKLGSVVAIEPSTGEILALVSSPSYDPELLVGRVRTNNFKDLQSDPLKPLFNRASMAMYPPGSTFKLINGLIGLQEGVLRPEMRYPCHGGYPYGRGVGCHEHRSPLDLIHSVENSCNAYFCYVFRNIVDNPKYSSPAEALGEWRRYVQSFGFGKRLGSDVANELNGIVASPELYNRIYGKNAWKSITIVSLSIGQGELGITPLQMANMSAILANRGHYYTPHLVKRIDGDKGIDPKFKVRHQTLIDTALFRPIVEGMYLAVNGEPGSGATARRAAVPGLDICGKTGTAQNPHGDDHSIFIAFAPKDNPKIAIAVYVENGGFGATYAAPIASLMIEKYLKDSLSRPELEKFLLDANLMNPIRSVKKK